MILEELTQLIWVKQYYLLLRWVSKIYSFETYSQNEFIFLESSKFKPILECNTIDKFIH